MKKRLIRNSIWVSIIGIAVLFVQCKSDEGTTVSKLNGTVTLDGSVADGAIVTLSSQPNAAAVVATTVTDEAGAYSIMGLENGTYYVNARYEPSNNNNLKSTGTVILTGMEEEVVISGNTTKDIAMAGQLSSGDGVISLTGGSTYDNTHSSIAFNFPYDAENAIFSGHFSRAGIDELEFDETNPSATKIRAWVDVVSIETGAPGLPCDHGRDGIHGCITSSFKVNFDAADTVDAYCKDGEMVTNWPNETLEDYDLWGGSVTTTYQKQSSIVEKSGVATFVGKSVEAFGNGYVAKGDFTFAGVTNEVTLYFNYIQGYQTETTAYSSLYGWFKFAALDDFGISSSHLGGEMVTVKLSIQFRKTL